MSADMEKSSFDDVTAKMREVQDDICKFLISRNGGVIFREDNWQYNKGSGGGRTRVWEGGPDQMFEKAGVNYSAITGAQLPKSSTGGGPLANVPQDAGFKATGVSLVIHPRNPHIPTIHMNIRYFESGETSWFGGGIDLTPYYPNFEQVQNFHLGLRDLCNTHKQPYDEYKKICDDYFTLKHRKEMRGVGGIFFENLSEKKTPTWTRAEISDFVIGLGMAFKSLYGPFLDNAHLPWQAAQREYQLWRRSRYVEFNLIWDRGTKFGIESEGRTESILMSLPTTAKWYYDYVPREGTVECTVQTFYLQPQDWVHFTKKDAPIIPAGATFDMESKIEASTGAVATQSSTSYGNLLWAAIGFAAGTSATIAVSLLYKSRERRFN